MQTISISELKTHPAKAITQASDYPLQITGRNKPLAYLIGEEIFGKIVSYLEDHIDKKEVKETDFKKGRDFEHIAKELAI